MLLLYVLGLVILLMLSWQVVAWFMIYRRRLRLKLEPLPPGPDLEINPNPELGRVRVRPRVPDDAPVLPAGTTTVLASAPLRPGFAGKPEATVPGLSVSGLSVPTLPASDDDNIPVLLSPVHSNPVGVTVEQQDMFAHEAIAPPPPKKHEHHAPGQVTLSAAPPAVPASRSSILYETPVVEPVRPVAAAPAKTYVDVEEVIALHVVCSEHGFNGEDLLRAILAYGLRFGDMSIFHRHEQPTGQGRILFSMAKAVEPGIFDLEAMTGEDIPGVSFFLSLPGVNSISAYDIMVDTVKRLATELQGHVLDEQQQPLTRQLIEHYRERVQEFERRRLMNRPAGH